jgi:beta-lactamase regulating signal transducer with metallopeptidase domain
MEDLSVDLVSIISIFISVILGLGLTNTVSDYSADIVAHNNSSEILIMIAPFIPVIWLVGCFGLAALLGYGLYRRHKK